VEDGGLNPSSSAQDTERNEEKSYTEVFEEQFPFYINAGMTPEQYWDGDVDLAKGFRVAYWDRVAHENEMAWLQGFYFYSALTAVMPATSIKFRAKKFGDYTEPIPITPKQKKRHEADEKAKSLNNGMNYMLQFASAHNSKSKKG